MWSGEKCNFLGIAAYINLWYAFSALRVYSLLAFEGQASNLHCSHC